jgi:hypothetical protein
MSLNVQCRACGARSSLYATQPFPAGLTFGIRAPGPWCESCAEGCRAPNNVGERENASSSDKEFHNQN